MKEYAYIRVSSRDQNIARQVESMKEIGLMGKQLYIDRLGRNYEEIIVQ